MLFEQQVSPDEQSLFCVHATQVLVRQWGVEPLHAAQVEPQCASTSHAAQPFEEQYSPAGQPLPQPPPLDVLLLEVLPLLDVLPELLLAVAMLPVVAPPPVPPVVPVLLVVPGRPPAPPSGSASWQRPSTQT